MLQLKDLKNRIYCEKDCISFEYELNDFGVENERMRAFFERCNNNYWKMQIINERTLYKDSEVYTFYYEIPKRNMPLDYIASMGLKMYQMHLKEEVQVKSLLDVALGQITNGVKF